MIMLDPSKIGKVGGTAEKGTLGVKRRLVAVQQIVWVVV